MSRAVKEWVGKTDDSMPSEACYRRMFKKQKGRCPQCGRPLTASNVTREHVRPLSMGGENREKNLQLWCTVPCSRKKTSEEAAPRAKADRVLSKRMGFKSPSKFKRPPMPGSKKSKWKKPLHGPAVLRDPPPDQC